MEEEKLDLKSILQEVKLYWKAVWQKLVWIGLFAVICTAAFVLSQKLKKPKYTAELTFMVNDDEGGGMSGIGAILGQIGMGGGGGNSNYQKIVEIAKSDRILSSLIMDTIELGAKQDVVGNHIIDLYEIQEAWEEDTLMNGFRFGMTPCNQRKHNRAIKSIIGRLIGNKKEASQNCLLQISYNEESSILNIACNSVNPELSIGISKAHFLILSDYYIAKSVEPQQKTYEQLTEKADSIYGLLYGSEQALASYEDQSRGIILMQNQLPKMRNQRKLQMYGAMYAEIVKNQQTAEFMLKSQTPYFQLIDIPFVPLRNQNKLNLILTIVIFIAVSILGVLFVVGLAYYQNEIKPLLEA